MRAFGHAFRVREAQNVHRHRRGPGIFRAHHVAICPESDENRQELSRGSNLARVAFSLVRDACTGPCLQAESAVLPMRQLLAGVTWTRLVPAQPPIAKHQSRRSMYVTARTS